MHCIENCRHDTSAIVFPLSDFSVKICKFNRLQLFYPKRFFRSVLIYEIQTKLNFYNLLLNAIRETTKYLNLHKSYMNLYCLAVNHFKKKALLESY